MAGLGHALSGAAGGVYDARNTGFDQDLRARALALQEDRIRQEMEREAEDRAIRIWEAQVRAAQERAARLEALGSYGGVAAAPTPVGGVRALAEPEEGPRAGAPPGGLQGARSLSAIEQFTGQPQTGQPAAKAGPGGTIDARPVSQPAPRTVALPALRLGDQEVVPADEITVPTPEEREARAVREALLKFGVTPQKLGRGEEVWIGGQRVASGAPERRNYQPKEVLLDGRPAMVGFDPTENVYVLNGQDVTARVRPTPPASIMYGPAPMGKGAKAQLERAFAADWSKETSAAREMRRQLGLMKVGVEAAQNDSSPAGSQAVLVTFQKILDPTSVVRESEYARSATGQSVMSQLEGMVDKWRRGGAGVPVDELKKFVTVAEQMLAGVEEGASGVRTRLTNAAKEYDLTLDNIIPPSDPSGAPRFVITPAGR